MKFKDAAIYMMSSYIVVTSVFGDKANTLELVTLWIAFSIAIGCILDKTEEVLRAIRKWLKRKNARRAATQDGRTRKFITVKL